MKEDKVREAYELLKGDLRGIDIFMVERLLREAIAPEQPEIPEGCPVLVWEKDWDDVPMEAFYTRSLRDKVVRIDYQRKGHVIPWGGGECPVEGELKLTIFRSDSGQTYFSQASLWDWENDDISAYVIWPEWVK